MNKTHILENTTYEKFIDFYNEINNQELRFESDKEFLINGCRFKEEIDFKFLLNENSIKHIAFNQECIFEKNIEYVNIEGKKQETTSFEFIDCVFNGNFQFKGYILNSLTLTSCIFKKECTIHCDIEGVLRLSGSTFEKEFSLANAIFRNIILFTDNTDHPIFKGEWIIFNSEIYDARFWDNTFEKAVRIANTKFYCSVYFTNSTFMDELIIVEIDTIGKMEFEHPLYIDNSRIQKLELSKVVFDNYVTLNNTDIANVKFGNVLFSRYPLSLSGVSISTAEDEYTARVLKNEAMKGSNETLALDMKSKELNYYYARLKWKYFFKKAPLFLMKWSNFYGTKWFRAFVFTFFTWILSYSFFVMARNGIGYHFIWLDLSSWKEAIKFLWLLNSASEIESIKSGWQIPPFCFGKIGIAYGIYQLVAAFRRHGK